MKKKFIVKKNEEFKKILNNNKKIKDYYYSIYYIENKKNYNRFGISVSKKLGNAVIRNKYKRITKNIIDNIIIKSIIKKDFIIILKTTTLNEKYSILYNDLNKLINKIK